MNPLLSISEIIFNLNIVIIFNKFTIILYYR